MARANQQRAAPVLLALLLLVTVQAPLATTCDSFRPETVEQADMAYRQFRLWLADARQVVPAGFTDSQRATGKLDRLDELPPCQGRGQYRLRRGEAQAFLVQVPHRYFDRLTGVIGIRLYQEHPIRMLALNNARRASRVGEWEGADLAHIPHSTYLAVTRAFIDIFPSGRVLQIHGFSAASRVSQKAAQAAAIVSDGTRYPGPLVHAFRHCLATAWQQPVELYGATVMELGGTRNVQGQMLRRTGSDGFLHLELSLDMRQRLAQSRPARAQLFACLQGIADD